VTQDRPGPALPWADAWEEALYGPHGFYRRTGGPAAHFRTGVSASPLLAGALARLARACGLHRVVDVGAGRGELLGQLAVHNPTLELVGVDVVPRPTGQPASASAGLPASAGWLQAPGGAGLPPAEVLREVCRSALVVAHEWLDVVPCPVLEVDGNGVVRQVEVDVRTGSEWLGARADADDLDWVRRWWAVDGAAAGTRVEVGVPRDRAWASLLESAPDAVLLAVDYAHAREDRPPFGTLAGFRDGRACPPRPDGSCDITAHVALDAVAAAGRSAGASATLLTTQRRALLGLGVDPRRPAADPGHDPRGYLAALQRAGEAAELVDPGGLGGFGWLLQSTGPPLPDLAP